MASSLSANQKVAVVTGSSSGIGFETSLTLARNGFLTYATMRNLNKSKNINSLAEKEKLPLKIVQLDVTDDGSVKNAMQWYLFALMDDETRFWVAQQVADNKNTDDIRPLFKEAKEIAGKNPNVIISDGARNFHDAFNKEFFTLKNPRTKHMQHIRLTGDIHNNKMERFNGEIRDREKVMRGLKKVDTPILTGYQIYHNYETT